MRIAFIDAETFWSAEYTLKKLSPGQYHKDERFQLISWSVRIDENGKRGKTYCVFGEAAIRQLLTDLRINECMVVAHNMNFDAIILVWHMGFHPRAFACTLSMMRAIYGRQTNVGLGVALQFLSKLGVQNIVPKWGKILDDTKGKRLEEFNREELFAMAKYNCEDTDNCAGIFYHLLPFFSAAEMFHMDTTLRARIYPELELDIPLLERTLVLEKDSKRSSLLELAEELNITAPTVDATFEAIRARLSSTPKFVSLLESLDVEVPYKPSPKNPKKMIPALAKTDEGFLELLDGDDIVAQAAQARLAVKSTLLETRIGKLITARQTATALPIPLRTWGAVPTWRWSGEEYNPQNLPRINLRKPRNSDALRQSIHAPDGYVLGVADQSSIELRVNHFLWGVARSIALYNADARADLYRDFASARYKKSPAEVTDEERQVGKVSHLGLGFGAGPPTFLRVARIQGGIKTMELDEATSITYDWRDTYHQIPTGWGLCHDALQDMAAGRERKIDPRGLCHTVKNGIVLPSGNILRYPNLREAVVEDPKTGRDRWEWIYGEGRFVRRIYGPKVDENIVQAIARDTVSVTALEFFKLTGLRWKMMTHDELAYLFPVAHATELMALLHKTMRTRVKWWPELVLWSAGGVARIYSDAK